MGGPAEGIEIREEAPADAEAIRTVHRLAFGQPQEAGIVDALREGCSGLLSLVACKGDRVLGHILFSPATIVAEPRSVHGMGLAPMGVLPEAQGRGVGSRLVEAGITRLRNAACPFVIVVGHPEYYPRFGFERASRHGVRCELDVPDEVFLILVLDESALAGVSGTARYHPALTSE